MKYLKKERKENYLLKRELLKDQSTRDKNIDFQAVLKLSIIAPMKKVHLRKSFQLQNYQIFHQPLLKKLKDFTLTEKDQE